MSFFIDLCNYFVGKKIWVARQLSWSHNGGVNMGTTLLLYVVIFTIMGVRLSHFVELVSSTPSLVFVCVCVCVCAISFILMFSTTTQCSRVLHFFSHSTTAHYAFSMIIRGRLDEKANPTPFPTPFPTPINHIRSYLTICLSITHSPILFYFGNIKKPSNKPN